MSEELVDATMTVNESAIKGFFREYRFLSNFHVAHFIDRDGVVWQTTEHFYQAKKSPIITEQDRIRLLPLNQVKKAGRDVEVRNDWEEIKDAVMFEALLYKFTQHEDLKKQLLNTGTKHLEEANWWKDMYWGTYKGKGENKLGKALMRLRGALEEKEIQELHYETENN